MKIIVISYSLTGNNEALAKSVAKELKAEHIKITEPKHRTIVTIIIDTLFNRTPQVNPSQIKTNKNELVIFVGPVWMGMVATPFRAYFKQLREKLDKYAFVSISGGAIGNNPKLKDELEKRLSNKDIKTLTDTVLKTLRENIKNE